MSHETNTCVSIETASQACRLFLACKSDEAEERDAARDAEASRRSKFACGVVCIGSCCTAQWSDFILTLPLLS